MRISLNKGFLLVQFFICALLSSPAWAEEGGADKGLPQFDTSLFVEQLFWLAVSFGLLYLLMSRIALPRVAATQDNRQHVISSEIAAAHAANDAAKAAYALVEKSLNDARSNAQTSVNDMMTKVNEKSTQKKAAQERELLRRLRIAEEEIAVTREAALYAVGGASKELADQIIDKVVHSKGRVSA